jgi:Uma2 family endonuclease
MSIADLPPKRLMTVEEFLELPDDGVDRELINGELWEESPEEDEDEPKSLRNADHSLIEANVCCLIKNWRDALTAPRGKVAVGEAAFRLQPAQASFVGVDVAYVSDEVPIDRIGQRAFFDGPPVLAVEILSPSDRHGNLVKKVCAYLEVRTVFWVVDVDLRTVVVYRPGGSPESYNDTQELDAAPDLPGFHVPVAKFFET